MTSYQTRYVSKTSYADTAGGPGRLYALLISHDQLSVQTVTLYDNIAASGTVLAAIHVAPERSPALLDFSAILGGKKSGLSFSAGLSIAAGAHAEVTTWELRY